MLDIKYIRENPQLVQEKAKQKGYEVDVEQLLGFDKERRELLLELEKNRKARNDLTSTIKGQPPSDDQIQKGKQIKDVVSKLEHQLSSIELEFETLLNKIPNISLDQVPIGLGEENNKVIKEWGNKPTFNFEVKNHWQIGEAKDWIDKERAAKVSSSRFTYIKGDLALLEFALWQFALSQLTNEEVIKEIVNTNNLEVTSKAFTFIIPPAVAKKEVYEATGRLNKEEQTYKIEGEDLWLNASAEHTMAPLYLNEIIPEEKLPIRYVGYSTAFRREAGTYGKDMEGILRLHQFNKLEMESFTTSDNSLLEHLLLIAIQEHLMQKLELPYQLVEKCTGEIGFPNAKGVDLEVWLPGQNKYRETHTADYLTDFQARGLKTRIKKSDGTIEYAHTNDATAFSERPLIAILENNQTEDGDVVVPEVLKQYIFGKEKI
ncbi:MAG TPA: serine--tRNA ligase [Patescibacteria group bacterium]|nr:serine--tRNA ligase [Patescibacteria group bacterium]